MPKMTSAMRAVLKSRREKVQRQNAKPTLALTDDEIEKARDATAKKIEQILVKSDDSDDEKNVSLVARNIESALFDKYGGINDEYKRRMRQLFTSLRNPDAGFCGRLLSNELDTRSFVDLDYSSLLSEQQKSEERELQEENMRQHTIKALDKDDINKYKDGRDREKWGVSRSAAAVEEGDA